MMLRMLSRLCLAAAPLALLSCAPNTQLIHSWVDPGVGSHTYKKIVVVGATPRSATRRIYEDSFAAELQARGITAVPSYTFGDQGQIDKDAAVAKLKEVGADAVLVTRLVDKQNYQTYYPPSYTTVAAPTAYYGGWYGYYSTGYSYMSSPGYVANNEVYRLETNLYDLQGDKLVWTGITETTLITGDPPQNEIQPLIETLSYEMEKHKVIPKRGKGK
jgi:flavin-binding protein dodecin